MRCAPRRLARGLLIGLATLVLCGAASLAHAQEPRPAVVPQGAPMYYLRDTSRTPIYILPPNTPIQVLSREGEWYRVVYHDQKWGDETGFIQIANVQFQGPGSSGGTVNTQQTVSQRGFIDTRVLAFPQEASNDSTRVVVDGLFREEIFVKPARWLQLAGGIDFRANSHGQVEDEWRVEFDDRGLLRPRLAVRRLTATLRAGRLTVDAGKQFVRWGRADILNPTDRFAPRDYQQVIDSEFLPVLAVRPSIRFGEETLEAVWQPQMTPSRLPLLNQRWTAVPPEASVLTLQDQGSTFPSGSQQGVRFSHSGRFEAAVSVFDGFNHLPDLRVTVDPQLLTAQIVRSYSALRSYGFDLAVPTRLFTLKGEAALFTSPDSLSEEYVLYVIELERQVGEWLFDGGYAGEVVTETREGVAFGAERGVARSFIGRASYTVDPRRTVSIEGAVRQDGAGFYAKGEFSEAFGQHWRLTLAGIGLGGSDDDFLGQYRRNSHVSLSLRLSF